MFGKKKEAVVPNKGFPCEVAGCGLTCRDEKELKRHIEWAHPPIGMPKKQA